MNLLEKTIQRINNLFLILIGFVSLIFFFFRKSPEQKSHPLKPIEPLEKKKTDNHKIVKNKTDDELLSDLKDL